MNDRFKFRFWDKEINQMRYGDVAIDNEGCPFVLTEQKKLTVIERLDNIIPLQCTGLKDKNGKLIYEGDVVRKTVFIDYKGDGTYQPDVYVDREYIGVVHFSASNGATLQKLIILETESPYEPKKQRNKRECPKATKLVACRSEVIGNIYENPELLKECDNE